MNKDNAKDYLPVVQALAEGKVIQFKGCASAEWLEADCIYSSAYSPDCYRVKPEPKEIWTYITPDGVESQAYPSKEAVRVIAVAAHRDDPLSRGIFITHYREVIE